MKRRSRTKGFTRAIGLMQNSLRQASETRGFAMTRLLTHWPDIVGTEISAIARPVKVSYPRQGLGATLTLLAKGAHAPMLEMQKPLLRDKVNACYGYNAITRIAITQTAPVGFAEGQATFGPAPKPERPTPSAATQAEAQTLTAQIEDEALRAQLRSLAANVMTKQRSKSRSNRRDDS